MKPEDLNDRLRAGTLPRDPAAEAVRVPVDAALRKATLRLVEEQVDPALLPMPSDLAAESAMLAALLWAGTYAPAQLHPGMVRDLVAAEMFFAPAHQTIFGTIAARYDEDHPVDVVSVHSALVASNAARNTGGLEYLEQLVANALPTTESQLRTRAEAVREAWARRRVIEIARSSEKAARAGRLKASEVVAKCQAAFERVADAATTSASVVSAKQVALGIIDEQAKPEVHALESGVTGIQTHLGGLWDGEVTLIAARTSVGKSAFAGQLACNVVTLNANVGAAYISLEMPARAVLYRVAASRAGVDSDLAMRKRLSDLDHTAFIGAVNEVSNLAVEFSESTTQTCASILTLVSKIAAKFAREGRRLAVIVLDHVHLITAVGDEARKARDEFMAIVSRRLRTLASRFGCHVLGLAQISREAERQSTDTTPQLHHIAYSSAFEQDTDNVLIIHRRKEKGVFVDEPARLIFAKARHHKTGCFRMRVEKECCRFVDPAEERLWSESRRFIDRSQPPETSP